MTPERHQQVKRLFLAAVELDPEQARQFLDSACGKDLALRNEIQQLLDHHRPDTLLVYTSVSETALSSPTPRAELPTTPAPAIGPTFPAGTMIANRYRLATLLGSGGMGYVYRAEDIELDQTVALKFLNPTIRNFPEAVDYLKREVRLARQITHPSVVRVFDIGSANGYAFISMEFVAGEDVGSLVKRVGTLPPSKVLQIAQQMADGLAAAHATGILHRDLKPGNVMIDGAGNVRIVDFGIASLQEDRGRHSDLAGTPAFLAPEILAAEGPSEQSDFYAWALVVYFAAVGKLPRAPITDRDSATRESLVSAGVNPELAECVCLCLRARPDERPASALAVVAAIASGDPLSAVLQAGHIPRPEQVTTAASWQPSARLLNGLFAGGLAFLLAIILLADQTLFLSRCGLVKSPDALREIAEQTLVMMGHQAPVGPILTGVALDSHCLQFVRAHPQSPTAWNRVTTGEIPAVFYWYRQGDPRLPRPAPLGGNDWDRITQPTPGTATVRLDGRGKLLRALIAQTSPNSRSPGSGIDWSRFFEAADLKWAAFEPTAVTRWPPLFAADVHAWEGPFAANSSLRVKVTAASLRNEVVFFEVEQPWERGRPRESSAFAGNQASQFVAARTALWLVAIAVAAVLAWQHTRNGRGDWAGAKRITVAVLVLASCVGLLGSRHNLVLAEELTAGHLWLNVIVFSSVIAGMAYLAVEPLARRWWPWSIITARRLLEGRVRDPAIWAEVQLGIVVGLGAVLVRQLGTLVNQQLGVAVSGLNDFDIGQNLLDHFVTPYKIVPVASALQWGVIESLLLLTLVVALKRVLKSTLAAAALAVLLLASLAIVGRGLVSPVDWLTRTLLCAITTWLLLRHGLLAAIAAVTTFYIVNNSPITLFWSAWYAPTGYFVAALLTIVLVVCWRLSRTTIAATTRSSAALANGQLGSAWH
jgi:hypothetical protein